MTPSECLTGGLSQHSICLKERKPRNSEHNRPLPLFRRATVRLFTGSLIFCRTYFSAFFLCVLFLVQDIKNLEKRLTGLYLVTDALGFCSVWMNVQEEEMGVRGSMPASLLMIWMLLQRIWPCPDRMEATGTNWEGCYPLGSSHRSLCPLAPSRWKANERILRYLNITL